LAAKPADPASSAVFSFLIPALGRGFRFAVKFCDNPRCGGKLIPRFREIW
jgi:hypothetical protein